jgi:hypothetical protein
MTCHFPSLLDACGEAIQGSLIAMKDLEISGLRVNEFNLNSLCENCLPQSKYLQHFYLTYPLWADFQRVLIQQDKVSISTYCNYALVPKV